MTVKRQEQNRMSEPGRFDQVPREKAVSLTRVVTKPVNELLTLIRTLLVAD